MRWFRMTFLLYWTTFLLLPVVCIAQTASEPKPQDATSAVLEAFRTHTIVMFGETHGNKQEYEWLCKLVATPEFADRVDDIVVEFGNSLYQRSVDRYIAGEDVPIDQVEKAWRNTIGAVGPVSAGLRPVVCCRSQVKSGASRQTSDAHRSWRSLRRLGQNSQHRRPWPVCRQSRAMVCASGQG